MNVSDITIKDLPKGIYYYCHHCQNWVNKPCKGCELRHGQVLLKVADETSPKSQSATQLGQGLIALSLVSLVCWVYFTFAEGQSNQHIWNQITVLDVVTVTLLSAVLISIVLWLLKLFRP